MITQTEGQIYLQEQRGCTDLSWYRSFHTFNYGSYFKEEKTAFGTLLAFNEDTLAAGKSIEMTPEENTEIIILPVAGGIEFKNPEGFVDYLTPGHAQVLRTDRRGPYQLLNPYGVESIHFLQIILRKGHNRSGEPKTSQFTFDPDLKNQLSVFYETEDALASIGKYTGREDGIYELKNKEHGVFAFVIQGAFEVQERLLQPKDGLTLWGLAAIEFEALSNDAILLLIEVPGNQDRLPQ